MKKTIITLTAIVALAICGTTANAQVFLDDEEMNQSVRSRSDDPELPIIPELNVTYDQYAPMGSGIVALGLLGGAYLLGKKRREE
jgi:hypothetical protein